MATSRSGLIPYAFSLLLIFNDSSVATADYHYGCTSQWVYRLNKQSPHSVVLIRVWSR